MATPSLKHGAHRINLMLDQLVAGTAADTSDMMVYDFNYGAYAVYDPTTEYLVRGSMVMAGTLAIQATNFFTFQLSHYNSAGALVDQIAVFNLSLTAYPTAYVPVDFTASAAVTGRTLAQGWIMTPGDTVEWRRVSNNATGFASPAACATLCLAVPN